MEIFPSLLEEHDHHGPYVRASVMLPNEYRATTALESWFMTGGRDGNRSGRPTEVYGLAYDRLADHIRLSEGQAQT
ncbi:hypothetical protein MTR_5g092770 [Medicago truncatula]|uniref:Uncharacterized protein n=1 Tax=Medicago truncatula TaxID=3880 RepID=G7K8K1_MEDTR|nr:hypothetical protein MTR_5g092770 [Medicago truncatula]